MTGPFKDKLVKIFWISKYDCKTDEESDPPNLHPAILTEITSGQLVGI
jgi:hypothetical protein